MQYTGNADYLSGITWTEGQIIDQNGDIQTETRGKFSDLVPVKSNKSYVLTGIATKTSPLWDRIHGYDANGDWVLQIARLDWYNNFSDTITIPNGISFIRISTEKENEVSMYDA